MNKATAGRLLIADKIDHLVLTVADIAASTAFYERVLGFEAEFFHGPEGQPRHALKFGQVKINLQDAQTETPTKAAVPTRGSGDFCLIAAIPLADVMAHLEKEQVPIEAGPVDRRGAMGPIKSVYFRDPDQNLIEVAEYRSR